MITDRKEADLLATSIHILRLMEMSANMMNSSTIERAIIERIKENPQVLSLQNESGQTIGMLACEYNLFFVMNFCLKKRSCLLHQDKKGRTMGHYIAKKETTTHYDRNLEREDDIFDLMLKKILKDNLASILQDEDGNNIGMLAAKRKSKKVFAIARKNKIAMGQQNKAGETIESIARESGLLQEKEKTLRD